MESDDAHGSKQIQNIIRAISKLGDELEEANKESIQRDRATSALLAVIEFIISIPRFDHDCIAAPLTELLAELHDLDHGRVGRILKPTETGLNPGKGTWQRLFEIYIVSLVDLLIKHERGIDNATTFIARIIDGHHFPIKGRIGTEMQNTIKNLRNEIKTSKEGRDQITAMVRTLESEYNLTIDTPLQVVKSSVKTDLQVTISTLNQKS